MISTVVGNNDLCEDVQNQEVIDDNQGEEYNDDDEIGIIYKNQDIQIEPLYRVRTIDTRKTKNTVKETLVMKISSLGKYPYSIEVEFDGANLLSVKAMQDKLASLSTNLTLNMKLGQFNMQKRLWHKAVDVENRFACAGHQIDCYAIKNAVYDYKTQESKGLNKSLIDPENSCQPQIFWNDSYNIDNFKNFFVRVAQTFDDPSLLMCFGTAIGVLFWDIYQEEVGGYPVIGITGASHTGKTTLVSCLSAFFGLPEIEKQMSGNSTQASMYAELYSRRNIPVFIEEVPDVSTDKLEQLVKNVYNALPRAKCNKQGISTRQEIFTTLVFTSNKSLKNPNIQTLSRMIYADLPKPRFNLEKFEYFDSEKRKALSGLPFSLFGYRDRVQSYYRLCYARICEVISDIDRNHRNMAIACSMWQIINEFVGYQVVDWLQLAQEYKKSYTEKLESQIKDGDLILIDIARQIENPAQPLSYGYEYKLTNESTLRLSLKRYLHKYNITNHNRVMNAAQFKAAVANDNRFNCNSSPIDKIGRAIFIDISKEEALLERIRGEAESNKNRRIYE